MKQGSRVSFTEKQIIGKRQAIVREDNLLSKGHCIVQVNECDRADLLFGRNNRDILNVHVVVIVSSTSLSEVTRPVMVGALENRGTGTVAIPPSLLPGALLLRLNQ